jgi:hypothetical protein
MLGRVRDDALLLVGGVRAMIATAGSVVLGFTAWCGTPGGMKRKSPADVTTVCSRRAPYRVSTVPSSW